MPKAERKPTIPTAAAVVPVLLALFIYVWYYTGVLVRCGSNRDRITLIPLINGAGELGPVMAIVKNSSSIKKGYQGNMKVLDIICNQFNQKEGAQNWQMHTYQTRLPYTRKARKGKEFVVDGGETVHRADSNVWFKSSTTVRYWFCFMCILDGCNRKHL